MSEATEDEVISGLITTIGAMVSVAGGEITIPKEGASKPFTIVDNGKTMTFKTEEDDD